MDPVFNEECADALANKFGFTQHSYALMVKDGIYQWRWLPPMPRGTKDPAVSPMFKTIEEAKEWAEKRNTGTVVVTPKLPPDGWVKVTPL